MSDLAWKRRFTTPTISEVKWSSARPERLGVISTEEFDAAEWAAELAGRRLKAVQEAVPALQNAIVASLSAIRRCGELAGDAEITLADVLGKPLDAGRFAGAYFGIDLTDVENVNVDAGLPKEVGLAEIAAREVGRT